MQIYFMPPKKIRHDKGLRSIKRSIVQIKQFPKVQSILCQPGVAYET